MNEERNVYVVCQRGKCAQTYHIDVINDIAGGIDENTKDVKCPKCNGVLIDSNGRANFSQNSWVIKGIDPLEYKDKLEKELKDKREEMNELELEIMKLEEELNY